MRDVSRETMERFEAYANLLQKWNPRINLVSKSTLPDLWTRHFEDSAQLFDLAPPVDHWVDLGSGGGFPGLVIAILATEFATPKQITLVESDTRKATFLRQVLRETGANGQVISKRIEDIAPLQADVLSARALADLPTLCTFADQHLRPDGIALFPKGARWQEELDAARESWHFDCKSYPSVTEPSAVILKMKGLSRV